MKIFSDHQLGVWVFANSIKAFSTERRKFITGSDNGEEFFASAHKFLVLEDGDNRDVRLYRIINGENKTIAIVITDAVPDVTEDISSVIDSGSKLPSFLETLVKSGDDFNVISSVNGRFHETMPIFFYDHQKGTIRDFVIRDYDYFIDGTPVSKEKHAEFVGRATANLRVYPKQMTLAELEKALGYKFEIV